MNKRRNPERFENYMNKQFQPEKMKTDIHIDAFDILIKELLYPRDDVEAGMCLCILQYFLMNIIPQSEGLIKELIENETEYHYRSYSDFLFHMGRLAAFIEMKEYWEALGSIEYLYAGAYGKDTFFQPKYVYNIVKILSRMGGKTFMMQRMQDEMSFKNMVELVNERSSEFKYIKRRTKKLSKEDKAFKDDEIKKCIFERKQREQFEESMECIHKMMVFTRSEQYKDSCDKEVLVDYLMDIIKNDLKYDCFANVIYRKGCTQYSLGLPKVYFDPDGNEHEVKLKEKAAEVDFSKVLTFSFPWNQRRIPENLARFAVEKFRYFESNHYAVYIPQFDMCAAYGGNHSIAMGVKNNQGKIISDVIDLEPFFGNVDTDGVYWFSVYDKNWSAARDKYKESNNLGRLSDFRIGLLFKLAEMKYSLEKNFSEEEIKNGE